MYDSSPSGVTGSEILARHWNDVEYEAVLLSLLLLQKFTYNAKTFAIEVGPAAIGVPTGHNLATTIHFDQKGSKKDCRTTRMTVRRYTLYTGNASGLWKDDRQQQYHHHHQLCRVVYCNGKLHI